MDDRPAPTTRPGLWIVALLALLYGGAHLAWYWGTPLGRSPVLDERENLQLAAQIADGTLPPEPFYRAMGYPLFLAGLRATGLLTDAFPQAATAAGLLFHVLNTWLVALLVRRWFGSERAGWIAGLLHGLNPVLIHYATQVLDAVPANSLFLAGLLCLPERNGSNATWKHTIGLSVAWAAAALVRPQLLLLWLAFPLVWLATLGTWRRQGPALLAAILAGGTLWVAQGLWSWRVGGEFRLLPWQGPYNLWAANHPGANGRYYTQRSLMRARDVHENPARLESEAIYRTATGDDGPLHLDALNAYWRNRLHRELASDPAGGLALLARKACYLAGNFEQYNNKTYSFHKERSPWLRWNPLGWGVLLLAGMLGIRALGRPARPLLIAAAALATGVLLSYASARFRLPLVALLCGLAGGALAAPRLWWPPLRRKRAGLVALLAALAVVVYGGWFGGNDRNTYIQDHVLAGLAAQRSGDDLAAWHQAQAVLADNPLHPDAAELALTSGFNLLMAGSAFPEASWLETARRHHDVYGAAPNIAALASWRAGDPQGVATWRTRFRVEQDLEALAALWLSGEATPHEEARLRALPAPAPTSTFQVLARVRFQPGQSAELEAAADRLFPRK